MIDASNFSPQSFAVVGAGPVGSIVACFLAKGGYEVTLCDVIPYLLAPALMVLVNRKIPVKPSAETSELVQEIAEQTNTTGGSI